MVIYPLVMINGGFNCFNSYRNITDISMVHGFQHAMFVYQRVYPIKSHSTTIFLCFPMVFRGYVLKFIKILRGFEHTSGEHSTEI